VLSLPPVKLTLLIKLPNAVVVVKSPVELLIVFKYFRQYLIHILIFGFIISLELADWGSRNHSSFNFYALPTRVWELLAGSVLYWHILKLQKDIEANIKRLI
jgi:hypothetical protein